jgi:transcription-repair coupling factor (superfamily II helicase)
MEQDTGLNKERLAEEKERLLERGDTTELHWQRGWFQKLDTNLVDILGAKDLRLFWWEDGKWEDRWDSFHQDLLPSYMAAREEERLINLPEMLFWNAKEMRELLSKSIRTDFTNVQWDGTQSLSFKVQEQHREESAWQNMEETLAALQKNSVQVFLVSGSAGQAERLEHLTKDWPLDGILIGELSGGFVWDEEGLALLTDHQIFNRFSRKSRRKSSRGGVAIPNFDALGRGDYVIHEKHGMGRYLGLKRVEHAGGRTDCLVIEYGGGDRVNVPVTELPRLEKHTSREGEVPELHKLGGKKWGALKKKARKKIIEIAKDLVELYARRQSCRGAVFPPDTPGQHEFEGAFPYEPTPDQQRATEEIKKDMQAPIPMDRLVCGDVGFGKTEVAMRAAFKAVHFQKQVAMLAPTTILVAQHYESFIDRFAGWPVRIEMLSRYKTAAQKRDIMAACLRGEVDILVGTHALLSKDMEFKDLGLLIIDEEQKFGVKQKERIRQIRSSVDTLSMSATPIPRTLHLSLSGARDISLISTPPRNRLPIETRVLERDDLVLKEALEYELKRGGQAFIVHDRVQSIEALAADVEKWVPHARVAVGHGQMNEKDLEQVMSAFMHHEFDVLVSTTIIESGLDVPNANTIIINNAQNFGVSQLYQLRGRVGRSSTHARAFLVTPADRGVSEASRKRLDALARFTDLGSGYQLAMRDLEIRGAGNLVGTEQHGFLAEVGYETYLRMVREAIADLQGEEIVEDIQPQLELPVDAYLSEDYIPDGIQRVALYQRFSRVSSFAEIKELRRELKDRFGQIPEPTETLLQMSAISVACAHMGVVKVAVEKHLALLTFASDRVPPAKELGEIQARCPLEMRFLMNDPLEIVINLTHKDTAGVWELSSTITKMSGNRL